MFIKIVMVIVNVIVASKICAIRAICATKNFFRVRTHFTDSFPLFIR